MFHFIKARLLLGNGFCKFGSFSREGKSKTNNMKVTLTENPDAKVENPIGELRII